MSPIIFSGVWLFRVPASDSFTLLSLKLYHVLDHDSDTTTYCIKKILFKIGPGLTSFKLTPRRLKSALSESYRRRLEGCFIPVQRVMYYLDMYKLQVEYIQNKQDSS